MVQIEKDPSRLEELLELTDRLNGLIKDLVRSLDAYGLAISHGATPSSQKTGRAPYGAKRPGAVRRNSKGKEKAAESAVLDFPQPSFSITGSDDEADQTEPTQRASSPGPLTLTRGNLTDEGPQATTLSKSWVEEEGEVFRKGHVLLGPQELGEEGAGIDSEELKREVRLFHPVREFN
jgi:protein phosphatase 1 regulatory subunit 37